MPVARTVKPPSVAFDTTLTGFGNNTGIVVQDEFIESLGSGRCPSVLVNLNGYEYPNTVAVMGGRNLVSVSAVIRAATGLAAGDPIHVVLTLATKPRAVEMPDDFAAALAAKPKARDFFQGLSNSVQRIHVDNINAAKAPETRQRRIAKCVDLFLAGKPR